MINYISEKVENSDICMLMQDGVDSDKLQVSEKSQKSRAILGRSGVNGIVSDQVLVGFTPIFVTAVLI